MAELSKIDVQVPASFTCGAEGEHEGPVVGCCYSCGLLLCKTHLYHMPFGFRFGPVDGVRPQPIVCGTCAGPIGKRGLPQPEQAPAPQQSPSPPPSRGFSFPFRLPSFRRNRRRFRKPKNRV